MRYGLSVSRAVALHTCRYGIRLSEQLCWSSPQRSFQSVCFGVLVGPDEPPCQVFELEHPPGRLQVQGIGCWGRLQRYCRASSGSESRNEARSL